jgi:hypothetical protein
MNARLFPLLAAVLVLSAGLSACDIHSAHSGPAQYDAQSVEMDASELVHVNLRMGAGDLRLTDGAQKLMRADFTYSVPSWKPEVRYTSSNGRGDLTIEQPKSTGVHLGNTKYRWDLQLSNKVPMNLTVNFGAGQARLDLGSLLLRGVELHMGVGQLDMDLRGKPRHDYNVNIHGGVGQATVRLPADAGIYAEAHGGIGSIDVRGLRREGGHWVSETYDHASAKIRLDINGGIGEIKVIAD